MEPKSLTKIILSFLLLLLTQSKIAEAQSIDTFSERIFSHKQVFLESDFQDGRIYVSSSASSSRIRSTILKQLKYLNGQLQQMNGMAELPKTQIEILQQTPAGSSYKRVDYRFKTRLSWDRAKRIPEILEMIVPAYGEGSGHERFYATFRESCSDQAPTLDNFFYHYAPLKADCPLRVATYNDDSLFFRVHGKLTVSPSNTSNKSPEYSQVWKDGQLIVTALFSKDKRYSTSNDDAGTKTYNETYVRLQEILGTPTYISESFEGVPGAAHPVLEMRFNHARGPITVYLRLVDRLSSEGSSFVRWYESKTPKSDLILYNGHAGLGANVSRLGKIGKFTQGQYQIVFINGCTTFNYLSEDLWKLHGAVNPGFLPSKHLDIMTNSTPSYFSRNDDAVLVMIKSMLAGRGTYKNLLSQLDPRQRALVDGEEDNP